MSRLSCLGLHDDDDPEKPGPEYGKSIFDTDENMVNSLDSDQNSNNKFKIDGRQYILDKNDLDNTHASTTSATSLPHACNLDPVKIKQL